MDANSAFLRLLDPDPDLARTKYQQLFAQLVKFFEWRQSESPEDLAQDTILRVLKKVEEGITLDRDDNTPYFVSVAKYVLLEARRATDRDRAAVLDESMSRGLAEVRAVEAHITLNQCLERLGPRDGQLLVKYHTEDRDDLRAELGLSSEALRIKVHRLKRRLLTSTGQPAVGRLR